MSTTFTIKQGDRLPALTGTITDPDGAAQDLTGATLEFHLRHRATGQVKVNAVAAIDGDPVLGGFRYVWAAGDTDTPGEYDGEIEATIAGLRLTSPNDSHFTVVVTGEIA